MGGKRVFEDGGYPSPKIVFPFKGPSVDSTPNSARFCGPCAATRERGSKDSYVVENTKTSRSERDGVAVIATEASRILAESEFKLENLKPNVPNHSKVDVIIRKSVAKTKDKFDSAAALEKDKLKNEVRNGTSAKGRDLMANSKASPQSLPLASENPQPEIQAAATAARGSNCQMHRVSLIESEVKNDRRSGLEMRPLKVTAETSDKSIEDEDQYWCIVGEKQKSVSAGKFKKQNEPHSISIKTSPEKLPEPSGCKFRPKEDEAEICIISPSEWNQLQPGFKQQNATKKRMRPKPLAEQMKKHSDTNCLDTYAEVETDRIPIKVSQAKEKKNLKIVPHVADKATLSRDRVQHALKLFEGLCTKLLRENKAESKDGRVRAQIYTQAAVILWQQNKWENSEPIIGHIPGIEIGDEFKYRAELVVVGLHHQFIDGIDCVNINGKKYATSIVDSGSNESKIMSRDVFLYSGLGGNQNLRTRKPAQKLEGGALALKNSMDTCYPLRIIRRTLIGANTASTSGKKIMYIYEGLYAVTKFWPEGVQNEELAFMFELSRISGQPEFNHKMINRSRKAVEDWEHVADDLSRGKEKIPIHIVNGINNDKPPPFTYIAEMKSPDWCHISMPSGCNCINGCSNPKMCSCAIQNGKKFPFNEEGCVLKGKSFIYECGPSCKCPPSCQNRVSQHGLRYQLEVFKTKKKGWGVRSRDVIPSGSFICEYVGELLQDKEAEERINDHEYLFDLDHNDGFTIDAAKYGNVARFINHSCSPNLYAQKVLYDHDDKRLPHIMLFATRKIPALEELNYHYNYKIDRVRDANGNTRKKICHCGSRKCNGRMY